MPAHRLGTVAAWTPPPSLRRTHLQCVLRRWKGKGAAATRRLASSQLHSSSTSHLKMPGVRVCGRSAIFKPACRVRSALAARGHAVNPIPRCDGGIHAASGEDIAQHARRLV
ncbi:hypothetical protein XabCFBP2524_09225 [Xanthomonas axonopodis pv. begoniae]|nr:hypothetical protein XabCFBP2524_09225 [Xanthomonas axonopodis pv. begoniae]